MTFPKNAGPRGGCQTLGALHFDQPGGARGFPNIKVRCLRTGARKRLADYCRGKVCVVDFWMTQHGRSPLVSMDA